MFSLSRPRPIDRDTTITIPTTHLSVADEARETVTQRLAAATSRRDILEERRAAIEAELSDLHRVILALERADKEMMEFPALTELTLDDERMDG